MSHFILAVGLLAGITGWNHRDFETRAMCRVTGVVSTVIALVVWGPAIASWAPALIHWALW